MLCCVLQYDLHLFLLSLPIEWIRLHVEQLQNDASFSPSLYRRDGFANKNEMEPNGLEQEQEQGTVHKKPSLA